MKNSLIFKLVSLVIIMAVLSSAMLVACDGKGSESLGADNNYQSGDGGDGTDGENKEDTQEPEPSRRVLLISIDGMRPDAIDNTEYGKYLKSVASYSLSCETVFPSVTEPRRSVNLEIYSIDSASDVFPPPLCPRRATFRILLV